ncbi:hypothetical protein MMC14_000977 [Varicellaria rhodocarpa]|nr:hypothetical protein [Varicellaria rhodocarpa]
MSFKEEAAASHLDDASASPPAYHLHEHDQRYMDDDDTVRQQQEIPLDRNVSTSIPGLSAGSTFEPLSLTMDDDLIYPTLPPSNALYHIPRRLTWTGNSVYLKRSIPERLKKDGTRMPAESQELYDIAVRPYSTTVELMGKRASCFGKGKGIMVRPSVFHDVWEVSFQNEIAVKYKKSKWLDPRGKVLATEEKPDKATTNLGYKQRRILEISAGADAKLTNLLVACWTAKVWRELQVAMTKERQYDRIKEAFKTGKMTKVPSGEQRLA